MKVRIDEDICTGCGLCADACPDVFVMEDDIAKVNVNPVPPDTEDDVRQAIQDCPVEAISEVE